MEDLQEEKEKRIKIFRKDRLKKLRKQKGMTHAVLAEEIGVELYTVQRYQSGRQEPTLYHLASLCRTLNVTADYFLGLVDEAFVLHSYAPQENAEPLLVSEEREKYRTEVMPDWKEEKALMAEGLKAITEMTRQAGRFMAYEQSYNYKTKALLEILGKMTEAEKSSLFKIAQEMQEKKAAKDEK